MNHATQWNMARNPRSSNRDQGVSGTKLMKYATQWKFAGNIGSSYRYQGGPGTWAFITKNNQEIKDFQIGRAHV